MLSSRAVLRGTFTFLCGTQSVRAQSLMTGALALMILRAILIIIALDRPFTGSVHVTPQPLADALAEG